MFGVKCEVIEPDRPAEDLRLVEELERADEREEQAEYQRGPDQGQLQPQRDAHLGQAVQPARLVDLLRDRLQAPRRR